MVESDKGVKGREWLKGQGLAEIYPYKLNGCRQEASSLEEVYFKAIFSYDTFEYTEGESTKFYSVQEHRNIANILRFQHEIGAYYAPFQVESSLTKEEMQRFSQTQIRSKLTGAYNKNKGIYYISGLQAYTSSLLFENPVVVGRTTADGKPKAGVPFRIRYFGLLSEVVSRTLKLFDGTESSFSYPYLYQGIEQETDNIYDLYKMALMEPLSIELLRVRQYFSGQQKRIIKHLQKKGLALNDNTK